MKVFRSIMALCLIPTLVFAQTGRTALPKTGGMVSLDFHDVDISDVVKAVAEITGKNFILDDRVRGKITIISPSPVTVEEAYQAFISALEMKNLTTVEEGKVTKIIPKREGKENPIPVQTDLDRLYGDQLVTQLIPLQYISSNEIRQALNALVSRTGSIVAYGPTNSLIVTDSASNIRRLMKIIQKLDKQGYQSSVEVLPLKYTQAEDIANKLQTIFESEKKATTTRRRTDDVMGGEAVSKIMPDTRTNSLIVVATREGLGRILDLVAELDRKVETALDRGRIHVKPLKHARADELADLLSNLFGNGPAKSKKAEKKQTSAEKRGFQSAPPLPWEQTGTSGGTTGLGEEGEEPAERTSSAAKAVVEGGTGKMFESEVRVVADVSTNSLVVTASPNDWEYIEAIIDRLDRRRAQVLVEALIMEVKLDKTVNVGLSAHGAGAAGGIGLFGQSAFGLSPLGAVGTGAQDVMKTLGGLPGLTLGALSSKNFTIPGIKATIPVNGALLKALQKNEVLNVLSAPNILTTDNKKAEILVGQEVPLKTSEYRSTDGTPVTSLSRQKIGIQLSVTPQINEGDEVSLEIEQKVQEIGTPSAQFSDVTTNERTAKTTVVAQNGQTIAIGGLIKDKDSKNVSKVPFLGDIPVLGYLFRDTAVTKEKINLIIFLTPHVIHDPKDMTRVSVKKNNERRRFNKTHGIGENRALYDYELDRGLNMAPPSEAKKEEEKPKRKFNLDRLEDEEVKEATQKEELARRRGSKNSRSTETVFTDSVEEEDDDLPRPRKTSVRKSSTSMSGNPFSDVRPPSSN